MVPAIVSLVIALGAVMWLRQHIQARFAAIQQTAQAASLAAAQANRSIVDTIHRNGLK